MWIIRLIRATWSLGIIFWSYLFQNTLRRMFPRSARIKSRWQAVHERNARRAYRTCVGLRGIYIKLGQVLSVMGTFLPACYVKELEQLQDSVPPRKWRTIRRALKRRLGAAPEDLFAFFSPEPVAAASLGQVHRATTKDGQNVAVKVLYPHVRTTMRIDMRVLRLGAALYKRFFVKLDQIDRVLEQLQEMLERETHLSHEARCIKRMNDNFASDPDVLLPRVLPELSNDTVLTMTFMEGVKISNREALAEMGLDPDKVATKLVQSFYKSLFIDRFFHADPHPGNFFVQRGDKGQAKIVVLDLGSASEIAPNLADGLGDVIRGFLTKDDAALMQGVEQMGFVAENGDRVLLERVIRHYFRQILNLDINDFGKADQELMKVHEPELTPEDVRSLMRSIAYPLGWFYVERAALILFGLSSSLAPKLNIVQTGFPYVARFLAERAMAQAKAKAQASQVQPVQAPSPAKPERVSQQLALP